MSNALRVVAALFGQTSDTLDWAGLRYQHTHAIRAKLSETRAPAGVNKILAALRGVLKEAWRLGLIDAENRSRQLDAADAPRTLNLRVEGSIPSRLTIFSSAFSDGAK
jgi:hypothetical protein